MDYFDAWLEIKGPLQINGPTSVLPSAPLKMTFPTLDISSQAPLYMKRVLNIVLILLEGPICSPLVLLWQYMPYILLLGFGYVLSLYFLYMQRLTIKTLREEGKEKQIPKR